MSKRCGQDLEFSVPKKLKTDNETDHNKTSQKLFDDDDIWDNDFNEEEMIKEIDIIISQRSVQEVTTPHLVNKAQSVNTLQEPSTNSKPSTSNGLSTYSTNHHQQNNERHKHLYQSKGLPLQKYSSDQMFNRPSCSNIKSAVYTNQSQIIAGCSINNKSDCTVNSLNYEEFQRSTFTSSTQRISTLNIEPKIESNDLSRTKLIENNRKLLADLREKVGETVYLRNRLKKIEEKIDKERKDKDKELKIQENKFCSEISALKKEKDELKTVFELQKFELETLSDRFKLLESGSVKFTQPRVSNSDISIRGKSNTQLNRRNEWLDSKNDENLGSPNLDKMKLHILINDCPLRKIPKTIYEISSKEKPVVHVQVVEKSGLRNLPILQEEHSLRIFENPELVKPLVTMIGDDELKINFYLPDLNELIKMCDTEINSINAISIVNKIVATTRELMLNLTTTLQRIFDVMTNDDVRDMNDIYLSEVYNTPVFHSKTIFDGDSWHIEERGIEARRSLGILSNITLQSTYLSEYIGGRILLAIKNDDSYEKYIKYMNNYNCWTHKNMDHEFLQLLLKFVTTVRLVKRAHQFTGLLSAVILTLINAHKRAPFQESGINYAYEIFEEIILSRPLLQTFIPLTQMLEVFGNSPIFTKKLLKVKSKLNDVENVTHYSSDACLLEMYLNQLQYFVLDDITIIKIADALISFTYQALNKRIIQNSELYSVSDLSGYTVKLLSDSLSIDTEHLKLLSRKNTRGSSLTSSSCHLIPEDWKLLDNEFWNNVKFVKINAVKKGLILFNYLITHRTSSSNHEEQLTIMLDKLSKIKGLLFRENEKEAIRDIRTHLKRHSAPHLNENNKDSVQKLLKMGRGLYKKR